MGSTRVAVGEKPLEREGAGMDLTLGMDVETGGQLRS